MLIKFLSNLTYASTSTVSKIPMLHKIRKLPGMGKNHSPTLKKKDSILNPLHCTVVYKYKY